MKYKVDKDGFMPATKMNKHTIKIEQAIFNTYGYGKEAEELFYTLLELREAWDGSKIRRQIEMEREG